MTRTRLIRGLAVALLAVTAFGGTARAGDHGGSDCCEKVCRPVPGTKTITTRCHSDKCEDFCLSPCSPFHCLFGGCPCCGKVMSNKLLVLKVKKCERPINNGIPVAE